MYEGRSRLPNRYARVPGLLESLVEVFLTVPNYASISSAYGTILNLGANNTTLTPDLEMTPSQNFYSNLWLGKCCPPLLANTMFLPLQLVHEIICLLLSSAPIRSLTSEAYGCPTKPTRGTIVPSLISQSYRALVLEAWFQIL